MDEFLSIFSSSNYMPHGHCFLWTPQILWLHVLSDLLIAAAYFTIPAALLTVVRKRHDVPFNWMFVCFATFIFTCGATHVFDIWNIWHSHYASEGLVKALTAVASISTAILLWRLIPTAINIPTEQTLKEEQDKLEREIAEHRRIGAFLESILEYVPSMIFVKEAKELRFVLFNRAGEELIGARSEDLLGKNDYDLFPKEQADFFTTKDRQVLDSRITLDIPEEPIDTPAHGRRLLHTRKVGLIDAGGVPQFLLGISQDITEQVEARDALRLSHLQLESKVKERTAELEALNEQLKIQMQERNQAEERFQLAVESSPSGILLIDIDGKIVLANVTAEQYFGYSRQELMGKSIETLLPEWFRGPYMKLIEQLKSKIYSGTVSAGSDLCVLQKDGSEMPVEIGLAPISTSRGRYVLNFIVDVTQRKQAENFMRKSLREKDMLLKEIHHRVKNNMQVISSLLKLQSQYIDDPVSRSLFRQSDDRVRSMALIHERLYRSEGLAEIDFRAYVEELSGTLVRSYAVNLSKVQIKTDLDPVYLGIDQAVPCGLLLNEFISNALKHAFDPEIGGELLISLREKKQRVILTIADNGRGLPDDFDMSNRTSLGFEIIHTLTEQLSGILEIVRQPGTKFTLAFDKIPSGEEKGAPSSDESALASTSSR